MSTALDLLFPGPAGSAAGNTSAHLAAHGAGLAQQAATLEVARQQLAAAKARTESAEAAARLNTQLHANAQAQLANDRALRAAALGAPTAPPPASPIVTLPTKATGPAPALSMSAPSGVFPVDRSVTGREAEAARQAADGPGFFDQLGAGLSQGLGQFLGNLQLNLGGQGQAQPLTITTGGGGGGGQDWTPIVLVGAAVVAAVVLLGGD